jgi:hypothetical protein
VNCGLYLVIHSTVGRVAVIKEQLTEITIYQTDSRIRFAAGIDVNLHSSIFFIHLESDVQ